MAGYGIVQLKQGEHGRVAATVKHDRFTVDMSLNETAI
jgi:hypothetical protein